MSTDGFVSLEDALDGHFEKRLEELPIVLRERVKREFAPAPSWGQLSPQQRRQRAREWDAQHDPANKNARCEAWDAVTKAMDLEREIRELELLRPINVSEQIAQSDRLKLLKAQLEKAKKVSQPSTASEQQRCRDWLLEKMSAGNPEKAKEQYRIEASALFKVSARGFSAAWKSAINDSKNKAWSRPGRKS